MENQPLPNTLEDLQPKVSRSSDFLGSTKFKRYPSYRDLKLYFNGTTRPTAHNIYTIPPTDGSFSEHGSIRATQVKSTLLDNLDNSIPNSEQKHTVDLKELMNFIQQTSTTSNSTRLGNETEKSSLSSCQSNTLSRGTTHVRSLIHMSPSTSFANQLTNAGPSYIAYSSPSLEGENDMFTVELNNEVTVESADLARVARPSFAYARNLSSWAPKVASICHVLQLNENISIETSPQQEFNFDLQLRYKQFKLYIRLRHWLMTGSLFI